MKHLCIPATCLLLTACGSNSVPQSPPGLQDMIAKNWLCQFCVGMPATPSPAAVGWQFDFPTSKGAVEYPSANAVHYVVRPGRLALTTMLSVTYQITGTESPIFDARTNPDNTCNPWNGKIALYFQRQGDDLTGEGIYEFYRWFATPQARQLALESASITASFSDPSKWISVYGKSGIESPPAAVAFRLALGNVGAVGMVFGGGCFAGHGVFVQPGTGTARFNATQYIAQ